MSMLSRSYLLHVDQLLDTDRFILFYEKQIVVSGSDFIWTRQQIEHCLVESTPLLMVEQAGIGGSATIALLLKDDFAETLNAENRSLRSLLFNHGDPSFNVAGKASQILEWYGAHRFCGSCGEATVHHPSQRALSCRSCRQDYFPRINPCAIMLVVREGQMLLARSARFKTGFFSCLAGFIEVGETPEQTVVREVSEEVGLEVHNVRYIKSQSWPFPSQLMLGFIAQYKDGEIVPEPEEIAEAHWYDIDQLPNVPSPAISVAGELIQTYIDELRHR